MPVAINMPQRQTPVAMDPLEKLATAVNIARQGYGIYADTQALERAKQQREEQSAAADTAQQAAENEQNGIFTPKERATLLAHSVETTAPNAPGAFIIRSNQPDSDEPLTEWVRSKKGEIDPVRAAMAKDAVDRKTADRVDKLAKNMRDDLDPDKSRAGNFGQISAKVQAADRMQTLVNSYKNGDLPPQQMEELALGMANMLSNSSGAARAQVEALVPHTWWGGAQNAAQWLTNEPRGAGQQKFVETMAHTIEREKDLANQQLNDIRGRRLTAHGQLKSLSPETYGAILDSYGMGQQPQQQGLASQGGQGGQYTQDVLDYAKQHNITPDQANNVKLQRTSNIGAR